MTRPLFSVAFGAFLVSSALSTVAHASEIRLFNKAAFEKAQAEGKTILVDVHAPWCPVCRAQEPIVKSLLKKKEFENVAAFSVDYDSSAMLMSAWKITKQATLVVFKGSAEKARSTGETSEKAIASLLNTGI